MTAIQRAARTEVILDALRHDAALIDSWETSTVGGTKVPCESVHVSVMHTEHFEQPVVVIPRRRSGMLMNRMMATAAMFVLAIVGGSLSM